MKKLRQISLVLIMLSLAGCSDDSFPDNGLWPPTETGAMKLSFLLDGVTWNKRGDFNMIDHGFSQVENDSFVTNFRASYQGINTNFALVVNVPFTLDTVFFPESRCYFFEDQTIGEDKVSSAVSGWVKLTHVDTIARIVSGRFAFDIALSVGDSVRKIRDGRFDVNYYQ